MIEFKKFNRIKESRYGKLIYNYHDVYIGRSIDLYGEYSQEEVELFDQIVNPGDIVLDIGANIGTHTLFFAKKVGPRGTVCAFEPQRVIFQTLCGNMALNNLTNVRCFHSAVGAERGSITVPKFDYTQSNNYGGLGLGSHERGEQVPQLTVDSLELSRCDFIKIDVEGMEQSVLEGAANTIAKFKPCIYTEFKTTPLLRQIDSLEYDMYLHLPKLFNSDNFANNQVNVFENIVSQNLLCVRKDLQHKIAGLKRIDPSEISSDITLKPAQW